MSEAASAPADALSGEVYRHLREIASRHMRNERPDHTLQPTALVHEAYLRLPQHQDMSTEDRNHYLRVASLTMRRVLIDHARARKSAKRDGALRVTLDESMMGADTEVDAIGLAEALERLEAEDPRCAEVVQLRFFAGLEVDEVAAVLGVSAPTVKRDWRYAKAWLARELAPLDARSLSG